MKERILEFLRLENKTSAQFAEEIGVQPSAISHIISGRNNPSLDFVTKMLGKYKHLSTDWLLFGTGSMFKEKAFKTLFDIQENEAITPGDNINAHERSKNEHIKAASFKDYSAEKVKAFDLENRLKAERIVYFFSDSHFIEYFPYDEK
jgi:transcriptional regulator with XRE-family HTH domain